MPQAGNRCNSGRWRQSGIDGKTITGPVIRTATSGARIEMNTSKIFGMDGTTELTTTYQDILSVTQTVPAGVLVVSGTIQFQVQSNNGLCECNAALIVDGTQHMWNQEVRNYQWAIGIIPINWCGDVAAGTRTWKLQAKYKDGTHTVYAMVQSYLSWQYFA